MKNIFKNLALFSLGAIALFGAIFYTASPVHASGNCTNATSGVDGGGFGNSVYLAGGYMGNNQINFGSHTNCMTVVIFSGSGISLNSANKIFVGTGDHAYNSNWAGAGLPSTVQQPQTTNIYFFRINDDTGSALATFNASCGLGDLLSACIAAYTNSFNLSFKIFPINGAVGTSTDIGLVGGGMLGTLTANSEFVLEKFGPPLFWYGGLIALFFALYYIKKVWID